MAEAARVYARRAQLGSEAVQHATEIKFRAERKAGEILAATPKQAGARGIGPIVVPEENRNQPATLAELGVTKKESSRYQKLARVPEDQFELVAKSQAWQMRREHKTPCYTTRIEDVPRARL